MKKSKNKHEFVTLKIYKNLIKKITLKKINEKNINLIQIKKNIYNKNNVYDFFNNRINY